MKNASDIQNFDDTLHSSTWNPQPVLDNFEGNDQTDTGQDHTPPCLIRGHHSVLLDDNNEDESSEEETNEDEEALALKDFDLEPGAAEPRICKHGVELSRTSAIEDYDTCITSYCSSNGSLSVERHFWTLLQVTSKHSYRYLTKVVSKSILQSQSVSPVGHPEYVRPSTHLQVVFAEPPRYLGGYLRDDRQQERRSRMIPRDILTVKPSERSPSQGWFLNGKAVFKRPADAAGVLQTGERSNWWPVGKKEAQYKRVQAGETR
ncbi:hypothetical protein BDZ89DRAFT_1048898 [Hymenopellis radicata]|nr:hypothetical protein BDZ89DRAFT_1048898 [Hymenopellis radicata]